MDYRFNQNSICTFERYGEYAKDLDNSKLTSRVDKTGATFNDELFLDIQRLIDSKDYCFTFR